MRIAVIGVGAVGGYFGGRLAQAGEDVVFLARGRTLEALRKNGLKIRSPLGDAILHSVQATDDATTIGPVDLVLIGVKAWQVPKVARTLRPIVDESTAVLPLQNGVDAPTQLAEVLGQARVLGGLCKIISQIEEPGVIHHIGAQPFIEFGELDGEISPRVERLSEALKKAGIAMRISAEIRSAMWQKFLFIASVSGIGGVTRVPIGVLREMPETRAMLLQSMEEIRNVGLAHGLHLPEDCIEKTLHFVDSLPAESTASMQRDLMAGRPSELESQNGAVLRWGEKVGVETPLNSFLYRSLLPMEKQAREH